MKTSTIRMLGKGLTALCLMLLSVAAYAQPAVLMELKNVSQPTASTLEYEIWLTNTGTTTLALRGYSAGVNAINLPAGVLGTLTMTYLGRDASLATLPTPTVATPAQIAAVPGHLRLTTTTAVAGNEVALTALVPVRLATIRVTTALPGGFAGIGPNFNWLNPTNPLQVTTQAGRTQCIATCYSDNGTGPVNYSLFGTANAPTATSLNVLSAAVVAPAGTINQSICLFDLLSTTNVTACDSYTWTAGNGNTYTASGTYDQLVADGVCTDTNRLVLTINNSSTSTETATACDSYVWACNGQTYNATGSYTCTSLNAAGCVNTATLNLTINASSTSTETATACDSYVWACNGQTYNSTGMYTCTSLNAAGCVNTATLDLTINASTTSTETVTACDSYVWACNGQTYNATGMYTCTSLNAAGCVNTATLDLTINASTTSTETATACDSYVWACNGQTYNATGMYTCTSLNAAGCVNTATLDLTINASSTSTETATACDTYTWACNGATYTATGMYTCTSLNAAGCVNTATLDLTINSSSNTSTSVSACDSYTWAANSVTYTASGTYTVNTGCATEELVLTITPSTTNSTSASACDSYTWSVNGMTYTASGTYSVTTGCATEELVLTINASTSSTETATACDTYTWACNGATYTATGMYTCTSLNAAGCVNTATLDLTINSSVTNTSTITANGSYSWSVSGLTYTTSGTYTFTSLTGAGCLSTEILDLTIIPVTTCNFTLTVDQDQPVSCFGNDDASLQASVVPAGSYTFTIVSPTAASSSNVTGYFNMLEPGTHTVIATDGSSICSQTITFVEPSPLDMTFTTDSMVSCLGNDGMLSVNITGGTSVLQGYLTWWTNAAGDTLNLADNFALSVGSLPAGNYNVAIEDDNGCFYNETGAIDVAPAISVSVTSGSIACNGGSTTITPSGTGGVSYPPAYTSTLTFTINGMPVAASYTAGSYTVTATDFKGCTATNVIVLSEPASIVGSSNETACDSYSWNSNTYTMSGSYTGTFLAANGCDSVHTLNLTINNSTTSTETATACDSYVWACNGQTYNATGMYTCTSLNAAGCVNTATLDLTINASTTSATSVTATGSYTWACNGQTYTASGVYTCTSLNAAGCVNTETLTLTIDPLVITCNTCPGFTLSVIEDQPISCNGNLDASLQATASPAGTYTYSIVSPSGSSPANTTGFFDQLVPGTHTVYATDGTCTTCQTIFFLNPDPLDITFVTDSMVSCNGNDGQLSVIITGGTNVLQGYLTWWTNAAGDTLNDVLLDNFATTLPNFYSPLGLPAGNYNVAIEDDHGCFYNETAAIDVAPQIVVNATYTPITCTGGTSVITPSGTGGVSYPPAYASTLVYTINGAPVAASYPAGTYTVTATDYKNCTGTTVITIANPSPLTGSSSETACDSYTWNGTTYTTSGTYVGTFSTPGGCDSIHTLNLTINYSTSTSTSYYWCDMYTWPVSGQTYTASGVYAHTSLNAAGCVNTQYLNLTLGATTVSITCCVEACGSYTWAQNGVTYTASGSYYWIGQNASGCPDVHTLCLTINQATNSSFTASACNSYTWACNGVTYTNSGMYTCTSLNASGCVNTTTLDLTITVGTTNTTNATACDTYTWTMNGMTYTNSGMYTYTVAAGNGCVNTEILNLTINNSTSNSTSVTACDTYTWSVNGATYTMGGTYVATSLNAAGCTHTETLNLTINYSSTNGNATETACDSYTWNGTTYTTSGVYTFTSLNASGCVNTATLNLTVNYSTTDGNATVTACDSYTWNGSTYTTSGSYSYTSLNASGCVNTATLTLTVNYSTTDGNATITACDSYTWNGSTYTTSGTYTYTSLNASGCTNTATLTLTINYSTTNGNATETACDSYTWNGSNYTTSGVYTFTSLNASGCVNTATLNLTVNYSTTDGNATVTACDSYTWNGSTYTTSGSYTYTSLNASGCVNTATLTLTINNSTTTSTTTTQCDAYTWNGTTYTTAGTYTYTSLNAAGCLNTDTLNLTINYGSADTMNVTACNTYTWTNGVTYTMSGQYTYTYNNAFGCASTHTLNLTMNNGVVIAANAMLRGAYDASTGLMKDSLRQVTLMQAPGTLPSDGQFVVGAPVNVIPLTRIAFASELPCANDNEISIGGGNAATAAAILAVSGPNAIVDWVLIEVRDGSNFNTVVSTKNALIQRDGDVVSCIDGTSPLTFSCVCPGNYYVSIKHRNHLGVMTANTVSLTSTSASVPFSDAATPVWVNPAIINTPRSAAIGSVATLWGGDANTNKNAKYNGLSNDKEVILTDIGGTGNSNVILYQTYKKSDLNMDGRVKYNNFENDKNWLLQLITTSTVGATPNDIISQHTPN